MPIRPTSALRYGSRGADVQHLQELLNKWLSHRPLLVVDGEFGTRTEAAVRVFQASIGIAIDGIVGMKTWAALKGIAPQYDVSVTMTAISPETPWLEVARKEIGQRERHGNQHNPRILEYHTATKLHASDDETPWCSSFVNWCLMRVNITGTRSASASSWINWGKPSGLKAGAITVICGHSSSGSPYHVAFFLQDTGSHFKLLGGNQSNRVRESIYPKSSWRIICHRWPK